MSSVPDRRSRPGSIVDRVRSILPEVAERTRLTEDLRQVVPETIETLRRIGFLTALVPAERGGGEEDILDWLQGVRLISSVCMSTGWSAAVLGVHAHAVTLFDKRLHDEVWSDGPGALIATSGAPVGKAVAVPGGVRLSGRFNFSSGCDYASWVLVGFFGENSLGRRASFYAALPKSDFAIDDVWHASGLKGTGSKDIVVEDAFVPDYRLYESAMPTRAPGLYANGLYGLPFHSIYSAFFSPVILGGAEGALQSFRERLKTRVNKNTGEAVLHHGPSRQRLVESTLDIAAAALVFETNWARLSECARNKDTIAPSEMMRRRAQDAHGSRLCLTAVDRIANNAGGNHYYSKEPLQRFRRDIHMASQHTFLDTDQAFLNYSACLLD